MRFHGGSVEPALGLGVIQAVLLAGDERAFEQGEDPLHALDLFGAVRARVEGLEPFVAFGALVAVGRVGAVHRRR